MVNIGVSEGSGNVVAGSSVGSIGGIGVVETVVVSSISSSRVVVVIEVVVYGKVVTFTAKHKYIK
jgi:hypothetical protein